MTTNEQSAQALEPCPFCGNEEPRMLKCWDESIYSHATVQYLRIVCDDCDAATISSENHAEAIAAWNRRHQPAAAQLALRDLKIVAWANPQLKHADPEGDDWTAAVSGKKTPIFSDALVTLADASNSSGWMPIESSPRSAEPLLCINESGFPRHPHKRSRAMADQYEELRRLAAEATPRPWSASNRGAYSVDGEDEGSVYGPDREDTGAEFVKPVGDAPTIRGEMWLRDARFIVAAVNALPSILAELDALREDARRMRDALMAVHIDAVHISGSVDEFAITRKTVNLVDAALHPSKDADSGEVGNG